MGRSRGAGYPITVNIHEDYLRSVMFGLQDGLVSTTGVVVGISTGVDDKNVIVLAAFVAVMVEATSMAAGQYSSEKAVHQMDRTDRHRDSLAIGAVIMFGAYIFGGLFSIVPTVAFGQPEARIIAVVSALIGLFGAGYFKGKLVDQSPLRSAGELTLIGAAATAIGIIVGIVLEV